MASLPARAAAVLTAITLAACTSAGTERAKLPIEKTFGPHPELAKPKDGLIPTVKVAQAKGWPEGMKPTGPPGSMVTAFAAGLDHPRWLYVLPNGDVLVAETNGPDRPEDFEGLKGKAMKQVMEKGGSAVPSANRITLLRDANGDGVAEVRTPFLQNLYSPFGMALVGKHLFIANADSIVHVPYNDGDTQITAAPTVLVYLPGRPFNHHWTKNIIASPDGKKLYATVGSNSNIGEKGMEHEEGRACIWEIDLRSGDKRIYASGLRNPVGMAWVPETGALWTAVNERDELGSDLVPDYMTSVTPGAFYGWPYSYYGSNVDERVKPQALDLVAQAIPPDYALGAHTSSLGLAYSQSNDLPGGYAPGMFVGQHGSWNRNPPSGYQVIFVPFQGGQPAGDPVPVLTGFLSEDTETAYGRPVGVAFDKRGGLLVADDVGNVVWRVSKLAQLPPEF
ncbi:MAG TPA: sorbosone dehydrogenase family protein [Candidatus Limnocylindrales bacterium]|nr:sorbosone dehydrogenase family protein [Candidatus Limnocylindrales bacterium]